MFFMRFTCPKTTTVVYVVLLHVHKITDNVTMVVFFKTANPALANVIPIYIHQGIINCNNIYSC